MTQEERLQHYLEREGMNGDLSPQQWESLLLHVKTQRQRRRLWIPVTSLSFRRPILAMAAALVIAVMIGGASLWITAPWEGSSPDQPAGMRGSPGRPAPRIVEAVWEADKSLIAPGEPITITFTLKNVWHQLIEFTESPTTVTLNQVGASAEVPIPLDIASSGQHPHPIEPGGTFTAVANITSGMSADLQPDRYSLRLDAKFALGSSEERRWSMGFASGVLFVVFPPEGALDTTIIVGEVREAYGAKITLKTIHFTLEETTIVALAAPLPGGPASERSSVPAPAPTATVTRQGTPTPTAVPSPPDGNVANLTARYQVDGEPWRQLLDHGYRMTAEGVHHEWKFGPVSANAKMLAIAIMSNTSPGNDVTSRWEWTIELQEGE